MWPFRQPLQKRIARDLAFLVDGAHEWQSNLKAALQEDGLDSLSGRSHGRHVQRICTQMGAARLRLMRDVGILTEMIDKDRSQMHGGSDMLELEILHEVIPKLTEPIRRYLRMAEQYPSIRKDDPMENGLQRRLKVLLQLGESAQSILAMWKNS